MKKFRKVLALVTLLCSLAVSFPISASAYTFPSRFWKLQPLYEDALNEKNYEDIILYAEQIVDLFEGDTADEAVDNLAYCCYELGNAYEALGRYTEAAKWYAKARPYYVMKNWDDGVIIIDQKVPLYENAAVLETYRSCDGYQTYYGAINEKECGVLFGIPADGETPLDNSSMVLLYQTFGDTTMLPLNEHLLQNAAKAGKAVEFAVNLMGEGNDLASVLQSKDYILKIIKMLREADTPVFLRFAAEFDTWSVQGTPEDFIAAFRFVADLVHQNSDNIAMVWCVTQRPGFGLDPHAYYPGDDAVDWIGMSLYLVRYFGGVDDDNLLSEAMFATGRCANPITILQDYIDHYGDRKPFIIAESGASHTVRTLDNRDETEWAVSRLKMLYRYLPMVFPQVKAIMHFDKVMSYEPNDFALSTNKTLQNLYLELVREDSFIQNSFNKKVTSTYQKLGDSFDVEQGLHEFSSYAFFLGNENPITVTYYVDGTPIGSSSELPYTIQANLSGISAGQHEFTVQATQNGTVLAQKKSYMNVEKSPDSHTIGEPLGNVLYTDIVTYINDCPIRSYNIDGYTYIVAEDLLNYGFTVTWDGINRRLTVGFCVGGITSTYQPEANTHIPGEIAMQYLYTDITAWFGTKKVTAYNIGGYTCIGMDDFAAQYADSYVWDNTSRSLRMTIGK